MLHFVLKMEKEFNITQNAARKRIKYLHYLEELVLARDFQVKNYFELLSG